MTEPASSCVNCRTNGTVSEDQTNSATWGQALIGSTRFTCPKCRRTWLTNTNEAHELGAFLHRARLT